MFPRAGDTGVCEQFDVGVRVNPVLCQSSRHSHYRAMPLAQGTHRQLPQFSLSALLPRII